MNETSNIIINYYFNKVKNTIKNKKFVENILNKIVKKNNVEWNKLNKNDDIIKLIRNYIIHKYNVKIQKGGKQSEMKYITPTQIKLQEIKLIKKICSFNIQNKVVIGEYDYSILKLRSGKYDAYQIDDNLMIINSDLNKPTKKMVQWKWKYSGKSVNVEGGTFGFFDLNSLNKINKILKTNKKIPIIYRDTDYTNIIIITGRCIEKLNENDKKKFGIFVVSSTTHIGDGKFECYTIGNDCAILIGGYTGDKLFWKS